jgi:hypothetical protein
MTPVSISSLPSQALLGRIYTLNRIRAALRRRILFTDKNPVQSHRTGRIQMEVTH